MAIPEASMTRTVEHHLDRLNVRRYVVDSITPEQLAEDVDALGELVLRLARALDEVTTPYGKGTK